MIDELRQILDMLEQIKEKLSGLDVETYQKLEAQINVLQKAVEAELKWREKHAMETYNRIY